MNKNSLVILCSIFIVIIASSFLTQISVNAIGVANIVVTNVYWGSDQYDPQTARPGDVNIQLSLVLSNVGDDMARDVNAKLFLKPPLRYKYYSNNQQYSSDSIEKVAGDMMSSSSFTLSFTLDIDPDAKEGIYRYDLEISYRSARGLQHKIVQTTIDIPIWKGELNIQNSLTTPTKIFPGSKQVEVMVWVANSGKGREKDLTFLIDLKSPFTASSSGSDRFYVGDLPPEQVSEMNFIIDVDDDATFDQYFITLAQETEEELIPIGEIPIYVNEKAKFEIIDLVPTNFTSGETGVVIKLELKNAGSIKVESVRVQLQGGMFFTGTLTDFLGTMLAGETKVAYFIIDVDSRTQEGNYGFDLSIDWNQDAYTLDESLPIYFEVHPQSFPVSFLYLFIIVIISIVAYYLYRRRKQKATLSR
jgi:hypothetical protein